MTFPTRAQKLEHWRAWAALYDPHPEEPPHNDNERRFRVNWWVEMAEGKREPSDAFREAQSRESQSEDTEPK